MNKYNLFIALFLLACLRVCIAQEKVNNYPVIGQPVPDFTLSELKNYSGESVTNQQLLGRPVILEFWSKYCSACAATFPTVNELHEKYKEQVFIALIGTEDKEERMRPMFEKSKQRLDLTFPYMFDSVLYKRFVPRTVPHLIWIDSKGIVQAITGPIELTDENIQRLIDGTKFEFNDASYSATELKKRMPFNYKEPFLVQGNGGTDSKISYLSRSVLLPYNPDLMVFKGLPENIEPPFTTTFSKGLIQGCATLGDLYKLAYTGHSDWYTDSPLYTTFSQTLILEMKDTSPFNYNPLTNEGRYWYSLLVPEKCDAPEFMMRAMQADLEKSFGFKATIETRKMPCWKLTATKAAKSKLKTKGGSKTSDHIEPAEVKLTDISMHEFISTIFYKHIQAKPPIIDETEITSNIDVEINANIYDLDDIRRELQKIGLILKEGEIKMQVIVISDFVQSSVQQ